MPKIKGVILISVMLMGVMLFGRDISRIDVKVELVDPPKVEYRRESEPTIRVDADNRWLKISVEYTPERVRLEPPVVRRDRGGLRLIYGGFFDNLNVGFRVLLNTGIKVDNRSIYAMFTGNVAFHTVRRDGRKHLIQMFIPAKLIDRFCVTPTGAIRRAAKSDFVVEVVFSMAGREVERAYCGVSGDRAFAEACEMVPENMVLVGGVLPRSRTPWALLGADGFDPEIEPQPGRN